MKRRRCDRDMIRAACSGNVDLVRAHCTAKKYTREALDSALVFAASRGRLLCMRELLKAGANVNAHPSNALSVAIHRRHFNCVKELLNAGADVHANYDIALRTAAEYGQAKFVRELSAHAEFDALVIIRLIRKLAYSKKFEMISTILSSAKLNRSAENNTNLVR